MFNFGKKVLYLRYVERKGGEINGSYICSISYRITMCNFSHLLPYPFRQKMAKSKSHDLKI